MFERTEHHNSRSHTLIDVELIKVSGLISWSKSFHTLKSKTIKSESKLDFNLAFYATLLNDNWPSRTWMLLKTSTVFCFITPAFLTWLMKTDEGKAIIWSKKPFNLVFFFATNKRCQLKQINITKIKTTKPNTKQNKHPT